MMEPGRRNMERFDLNVEATVVEKRAASRLSSIRLRTKNICAGGAFLLTDTPFPIGTKLDIGIRLAFLIGDRAHGRESDVFLTGAVVRTDTAGMAIKFDKKYLISQVPSPGKFSPPIC